MVALDDVCFAEPFRFSRASMRSFAQAKNACVVIAETDNDLAGFCILHVEQSRRRFIGYIVTLDVAPTHRRQGLATQLMSAVERMAADDGCDRVTLHVFSENAAAISFYDRSGYSITGPEPEFYGAGLDALVMTKPLALG